MFTIHSGISATGNHLYNKNNSQGKNVIALIFSCLFSIIFASELVTYIVLGNIQTITSTQTVSTIVKQANIAELNMRPFVEDSQKEAFKEKTEKEGTSILENSIREDSINENSINEGNINEESMAKDNISENQNNNADEIPLYQYIYSHTSEHPELAGLSEKDIKDILADENVSEFASEKIGEYMDFFITGNGDPSITNSEVLQLIDEEAQKYKGDSLSVSEKAAINDMLDHIGLEKLDMVEIAEEYQTEFNAIHRITTKTPFYILLCTIGITFLFLLLLNLDHKRRWFLYVGIPAFLVGAIFTIGTYFTGFVVRYISKSAEIDEAFFNSVLTNIAYDIRFTAVAMLGIGLLFIMINILISQFLKAKQQREFFSE